MPLSIISIIDVIFSIRLLSHPAMQREVDWKASQLVFLAQWAYFSPSASKVFSTAAKETFHRALDNPCKKLEDLSAVLSKAFDQVNSLVPDSEIRDEASLVCTKSSKLKLWSFFSFPGEISLEQFTQRRPKDSEEESNNETSRQLDWPGLFGPLPQHGLWTAPRFCSSGGNHYRIGHVLHESHAESDEEDKERRRWRSALVGSGHRYSVVVVVPEPALAPQYRRLGVVSIVGTRHSERSTASLGCKYRPPFIYRCLQTRVSIVLPWQVIDPSKKDMPLVDADDEDDSGESDLGDEEEEEEEEAADEEADEEDAEDEFSDEMDEEETITDKLRMKIHEALGDSAALTDTVRLTCNSSLSLPFTSTLCLNRNRLILMIFPTAKWRVWTKLWALLSKSSAKRGPSRRITTNCPKIRRP